MIEDNVPTPAVTAAPATDTEPTTTLSTDAEPAHRESPAAPLELQDASPATPSATQTAPPLAPPPAPLPPGPVAERFEARHIGANQFQIHHIIDDGVTAITRVLGHVLSPTEASVVEKWLRSIETVAGIVEEVAPQVAAAAGQVSEAAAASRAAHSAVVPAMSATPTTSTTSTASASDTNK